MSSAPVVRLSPSVCYVHRLCAYHGFFFGRHYRLINLRSWRNVLGVLLHLATFPMIMLLTGYVYLSDNSNTDIEQEGNILGKVKPGTKMVFNVVNHTYWLQVIYHALFAPFNGAHIIGTANHRLYRVYDQKTNFRVKLFLYDHLATVAMMLLQWYISHYLYQGRTMFILISMFTGYLQLRRQFWFYHTQFFVLHATSYWFEYLRAVASRADTSSRALLTCVHRTNQLLCGLDRFYQVLSPYILLEYLCMSGMLVLTFLYFLIGAGAGKISMMVTASSLVYLFVHLLLVRVAHFQLDGRRHRLAVALARHSAHLNTHQHIRLWCLGLTHPTTQLPPQVARLFRLELRTLLSLLVFIFDFAIVLYQTQYM